ncbi:MAG: AAA family ATPase [Clostridia bacterium]|nr:AAA family ATPase [Clostridia bacterium]
MKINRLEIENVKRVKAVALEPAANGLTVIGGKNGQGKTSVLDAIAWALGGDRFRPDAPRREGSAIPPRLKVEMDSGLIVERRGDNSTLYVTDPSGRKGGQKLLNEFVEQLALDLPRFLNAPPGEKAETLLKVAGVGDRLREMEREENEVYNRRRAIGQIADQKEKFAREMPMYEDMPRQVVSAGELIKRQQDILARNGENERKRMNKTRLENELAMATRERDGLIRQLREAEIWVERVTNDLETANRDALELRDESTEQLERDIASIEEINARVRANLDREKAMEDAEMYRRQYDEMTTALEKIRDGKKALLDGAKLPLKGLTVEKGELYYNGYSWDGMSGSEQLKVATAIVRGINPKCGFVLLDGLEALDGDTLRRFGEWLESESLQAIATRVSTDGDECQIIIEDGEAVALVEPERTWEEGKF